MSKINAFKFRYIAFNFSEDDTMKKLLLISACTLLFTGCVIRGPSVELPSIVVPSVSIDSPIKVNSPDSSYQHKQKKGCPPGLAKQGRC